MTTELRDLDTLSRADIERTIFALTREANRATARGERRDTLNRVIVVLAEHLIERND